MKKDDLEVTLIILSTSILLLIIMITFIVVNIEKNLTKEEFNPATENSINTTNKSLTLGLYNNTSDDENLTNILFNNDGSFSFNYNTCEGQEHLTGMYNVDESYIYLSILDETTIEKEFMMVILSDNLLEYRGSSIGCGPYENSVYMLK